MKRVTTRTMQIPQEDGTYEKSVVSIGFELKSTMFVIQIPEHIAKIRENHEGEVSRSSLKGVVEAFESILTAYTAWLKTMKRKKVIAVDFSANIGIPGGLHLDDISFLHGLGIGLKYNVRYQVGEDLYSLDMKYEGKHNVNGTLYVFPWTEERERFFASAVEGLQATIVRVHDFMRSVAGDEKQLDKAIHKRRLLTS